MNNITIGMIEDDLTSLDSEYGEALAQCLVDKKYLSDSPLALSMGTYEQQEELENFYNKTLSANEVNEIINYISEEMKGDFQYSQFKSIISIYKSEKIEPEEENEIEI